jgi:ribosomal protein S18 acetylase RimI-like enzyme
MDEFVYLRSPSLKNEELNQLFESAWPSHEFRDFQSVLVRSLVFIAAYRGPLLVGFVNVAWDGGAHGFILDPTVHADFQRRGIGLRMLREAEQQARASGLEWLHVDFTADLEPFYRAAGYVGTAAGVLRVDRLAPRR